MAEGFGDTNDYLIDLKEVADGVVTQQKNAAEKAKPDIKPERLKQIQAEEQVIAERREVNFKKYPDRPEMAIAAAASAVQAGDWKNGEVYADKAVTLAEGKKNPQLLADALRTRSFGALQAGDFVKAAADAKRILDMDPKDRNARSLYEASKGRVNDGAATASAPPAPAALPADFAWTPSAWNDPRVRMAGQRAADRQAAIRRLQEAMRHLNAGHAQDALDAATAAQRHDPSYADAYIQKALAWTALNELAKALIEVTKAIGLWTVQGNTANLPAAYGLRAKLSNDMSDFPMALSDADKALAYDPANANGFLQRGSAGEKIGKDIERAMEDYKRAAELEPRFQDEYEAALTRLADSAKPAPPARSPSREWLRPLLIGAFALLGVLLAFVWKLTRRRNPESVIGFTADRKELDSQYDIVGELGEGGMGAVFKGWDKVLKRPVAIKRLRAELQANPRERDRFLKEAEMVASLHHPHIVDIYTIIRDQQDTYLVFEYVSGMTVHDLLNESRGRRLPPKRALEILRQIAEAVDHAHARHVIHRDMKPSNVMLADGGWVKVMDFGIARQVKDSLLTTTNTIVGTPVYMAPEQAMGAVVKESDVFSLGVTLYELITGGLPFKGPNEMADKMEGRFVAPSVLVPDLSPAIDAVIKKALSPRPEERYHRCGELYLAAVKAFDERVTPATQR